MSDDLDARSPDLYDRYREIVAERDSLRVALVEAERAPNHGCRVCAADVGVHGGESAGFCPGHADEMVQQHHDLCNLADATQARLRETESRLVVAERQRDALIRTCEQTTFKVAHLPYWQEGWDAAMAAVLRVLNESSAGAGPVPEPRPETE